MKDLKVFLSEVVLQTVLKELEVFKVVAGVGWESQRSEFRRRRAEQFRNPPDETDLPAPPDSRGRAIDLNRCKGPSHPARQMQSCPRATALLHTTHHLHRTQLCQEVAHINSTFTLYQGKETVWMSPADLEENRTNWRTAASTGLSCSFIICSVFTHHPPVGYITIIRNPNESLISVQFMLHFFCSIFQQGSSLLDILTLLQVIL